MDLFSLTVGLVALRGLWALLPHCLRQDPALVFLCRAPSGGQAHLSALPNPEDPKNPETHFSAPVVLDSHGNVRAGDEKAE